ncbi:hypothetical protein [Methylobacterium sp. Leaf118]|nr:hypothetical protein [Methylobacterium sp. Leaf118]
MTSAVRLCPVCKGQILRTSRAVYCSSVCKDARNNAIKTERRRKA